MVDQIPSFLDAFQIQRGDVVSIVGSGGKVTLMYHLAYEALARGYSVLTTSSTHLHPPTSQQSDGLIVTSEVPNWRVSLPELYTKNRHMTVVGARPRPDKLRGLELETLQELRSVCPVDLMLIKADGARTRPFKAPGPHEPVVPAWTTHGIIVVGLQSVGLPLTEKYVHRPERVAAFSKLAAGDALTPEAIGRVVSHPDSYTRAFPEHAQAILYLGWCSTPERQTAAKAISAHTDPLVIPQTFCGTVEKNGTSLHQLH